MDANQDRLANPYGMDESCQHCPALCDTRENVVHGYGKVDADFLFVGEQPSAGADENGTPFSGNDGDERFQHILGHLGLNNSLPSNTNPEYENVFVTYITRCRHPDRQPQQDEITNCEPYLNAEIRMINPEILVPVGSVALEELGTEYTTTPVEELSITEHHATTIRGRGFEIIPMIHPQNQTDDEMEEFIDHFLSVMERDYRQTKGRRER
ncbi:MAG: uracil-DNA glycosylase family protein [Halobacteriaceae archaeon]